MSAVYHPGEWARRAQESQRRSLERRAHPPSHRLYNVAVAVVVLLLLVALVLMFVGVAWLSGGAEGTML